MDHKEMDCKGLGRDLVVVEQRALTTRGINESNLQEKQDMRSSYVVEGNIY
jgi:hypothetical protein